MLYWFLVWIKSIYCGILLCLKEVKIMQKEKILRELYRGNLTPAGKNIVFGSEFQKQQQRLVELEKEIEAMLAGRRKKGFIRT